MTATLRYDTGVAAGRAILAVESAASDRGRLPEKMPFFHAFGAKLTNRRAGINKGGLTNQVYTFAIKLPTQVAEASRFLELLDRLSSGAGGMTGLARKGCFTLAIKLRKSLGRPALGTLDDHIETAFLLAIDEEPGDVGRWGVYADWLEESGDHGKMVRAATIRAWSGKKAAKVTYGIPNVARDESWRET